ncbi:MAG: hypothetical protein IPL46_07250 [Saprospiraceae bacterium]|nr:hypothetical protein [Saprospiraceae bacterium]
MSGDSICLQSGKLIIDKDLTIIGHPQYDIPIDGTPNAQSIEIANGAHVIMHGVHFIVNPSVGMNAFENFGDLMLKDVVIEYLAGSSGGIFANEGTVVMDPEVEIVEVQE